MRRSGVLSAILLTMVACLPYGFAGGGLPSHVRTVAVIPFENLTSVPEVQEELANALRLFPEKLPTGVIVGSAVIEKVTQPAADAGHDLYQWHLTDVKRADEMRKPERHPQPVWFVPFE